MGTDNGNCPTVGRPGQAAQWAEGVKKSQGPSAHQKHKANLRPQPGLVLDFLIWDILSRSSYSLQFTFKEQTDCSLTIKL